MALTLRQRAASDPTESLKQALKTFETVLSDDRRQLYQQACAKPDVTSVVAFVTRLDEDNSGRARRCFAPRLLTFLNATRQFSDAVDTFVSSHPQLAALVWGGVKTAILVASNVASYFEKITGLIMHIGRFCPVYDDFGSLYPGAAGLQAALCGFYATIIELCTKIILGSQKTLWQQFLSPIANPFESEFRPFLDRLEQDRREVELQIQLASQQADRETARLLELDRRRSSLNWKSAFKYHKEGREERDRAALWRERQKAREEVKTRSSIRSNLSPIDHDKAWKQALRQRVSSTAEWFATEPDFVRWKRAQRTSIFWCIGNLGTGKSILVSNIIAHFSTNSTPSTVVAHFFCRFDDAQTTKARNILGSVSCQILSTYIESTKGDSLDTLLAETCDLDLDGVTKFLATRLNPDKTYYIVLDGLDECEPFERESLVRAIAELIEEPRTTLKILCAARPDTENEIARFLPSNFRLTLTSEKTDCDIVKYIDAALDEQLEAGRLKLGDPALIVTIAEALQKGSRGMFLWTRLMIDEICEQTNDNAIRRALEDLPLQLSDIFDRKLSRIAQSTRSKLCTKLLQFCGVTKRPLNLEEFRELLGIEVGQVTLDRGNLPNDIAGVVASCHGLVYADEEHFTVHYVHYSVEQHLFESPNPRSADFDRAAIDTHVGVLCMTYLNFKELSAQVDKVGKSIPIDPVLMGRIAFDAKSDLTSRLAQQILSRNKALSSMSSKDLKRGIQGIVGTREPSKGQQHFHLLPYAKQNWIHHFRHLERFERKEDEKLFFKCVTGDVREANRPWQTDPDERTDSKLVSLWEDIGPLFLWATSQSHVALVSTAIDRYPHAFWRKVEFASDERSKAALEIIANNPLLFDPKTLGYALMVVIDKGLTELIEPYLNTNLDIQYLKTNLDIQSLRTPGHGAYPIGPLELAATKGSIETVNLLLAHDKELVLGPISCPLGEDALTTAARWGHKEVVQRLLQAYVDLETVPDQPTALSAVYAARNNGFTEIMELLLGKPRDTEVTRYIRDVCVSDIT
ncbi:uncharacterized protein PV07_03824 [Cladophialophora immunda]|uniref:NACHT domain-containing protein n=1 Tax=Cladophialophora immunda TaxID=569365 RepID=A0A0D2D959_9EURO|nr:uncharacterized protein PV07_03824 [Cladophialophora immunda]KIW32264.1 hypothetical protein PV07_03824 [Cladophialophora immunda]